MRHRAVCGRSRQILLRVLAGAAVSCAVLGVAVAGCGQHGLLGPPAATDAAPDGTVLAPVGQQAAMPRAEPLRIEIPALGVVSDVVGLGLRADGTMEVPSGAYPAGWYTGAPTPGELGPAIIAGHVNWAGEPGVFSRLHEIEPGDAITVRRRDGSAAVFRVDRVAEYPKDQFPTEAVYGNIDHPGLRLITCGGDFDHHAGSYVDNIVVYATLLGRG
jgi:sortase (surface protein transpeptidase)